MSLTTDTVNEEKTKTPSECNEGGGVQTNDSSLQLRRDSLQSNASCATRKGSDVARAVGPQLPEPPDGGWGWMIVLGAILTGALVPSLFMCFGVFMNAFLTVFPTASKSSAAWIPSIMSSLMNCMGPITSGLVNLYSARVVTLAGGFVLSTGLVLSYFTSTIEALYFTYGILGGIGAGLSMAPGLYLISQYFKKRRGLATGICMAGSSGGQIVAPYLIQILLDEYNYRGCILVLGGITLNVCVAAALYRPLHPQPKIPKQPKRKRTVSNCSYKSSLTFLPDEGVCMTKNGNYIVMATVKNSNNSKKSSDPKKKRHKKSKHTKRKKKNHKGATKNEIQAILNENTWNNIKQADNLAPPRSRSRTLSLDSSRILPDIPEEREEDDGAANVDAEQNEDDNEEEKPAPSETEPKHKTQEVNKNNNMETKSTVKTGAAEDTCKDNGGTDAKSSTCPSITVTVVPVDCKADSARGRYLRRESSNDSSEVVSLHNCYGSVASIASIACSVDDTHGSVLKSISQFFGFRFFKYGIFYILSISFTLLIISLGNYTMFIPPYGLTTLKLSKDTSAGLISIIAIASMCGRLILPTIPDYVAIRRRNIYFVSSMFLAGSIFLTIFAKSYEILLVSLIVFGFTSGGSIALSIGVFLDYVALEQFTAFFGLMQLIVGSAVLFSTPLMGFLVDTTKSYTVTFCTLTALSATGGCILYLDRFTKPLTSPEKPNPV